MMQQELPLLVVATRNAHKTGEIRAMLAGKWEVRDLSDYPQAPPVEETGVTFTENATLKAVSASKWHSRHCPGGPNSGLEVDVLGGRPASGPLPLGERKAIMSGTTAVCWKNCGRPECARETSLPRASAV